MAMGRSDSPGDDDEEDDTDEDEVRKDKPAKKPTLYKNQPKAWNTIKLRGPWNGCQRS